MYVSKCLSVRKLKINLTVASAVKNIITNFQYFDPCSIGGYYRRLASQTRPHMVQNQVSWFQNPYFILVSQSILQIPATPSSHLFPVLFNRILAVGVLSTVRNRGSISIIKYYQNNAQFQPVWFRFVIILSAFFILEMSRDSSD